MFRSDCPVFLSGLEPSHISQYQLFPSWPVRSAWLGFWGVPRLWRAGVSSFVRVDCEFVVELPLDLPWNKSLSFPNHADDAARQWPLSSSVLASHRRSFLRIWFMTLNWRPRNVRKFLMWAHLPFLPNSFSSAISSFPPSRPVFSIPSPHRPGHRFHPMVSSSIATMPPARIKDEEVDDRLALLPPLLGSGAPATSPNNQQLGVAAHPPSIRGTGEPLKCRLILTPQLSNSAIADVFIAASATIRDGSLQDDGPGRNHFHENPTFANAGQFLAGNSSSPTSTRPSRPWKSSFSL